MIKANRTEKKARKARNKYERAAVWYMAAHTDMNLDEFSDGTLAFSVMLGLPAEECVSMYPESELGEDFLNDYDSLEMAFHDIRMGRLG